MKIKRLNEDVQNPIKLTTINDLKSVKSGKDIDKEIKSQLQFWLSSEFRTFIDDLILEIKKGTKIDDMPDKYKKVYKEIANNLKRENQNKNGMETIPQKIKRTWNEDILITKDIIILYLEDLKGKSTPNFRKPFDWTITI